MSTSKNNDSVLSVDNDKYLYQQTYMHCVLSANKLKVCGVCFIITAKVRITLVRVKNNIEGDKRSLLVTFLLVQWSSSNLI